MHLKTKKKAASKISTANTIKSNQIKRIAVKKMHTPVAGFMLSSVLQNSANISKVECLNAWTVCRCNYVDIALSRPSDCVFVRLQSVTSNIVEKISPFVKMINSVLFRRCSAAFGKSFMTEQWFCHYLYS